MTEFTPCPECKRNDFISRSSRDSHVYRCKNKKFTEPTQQVTSLINEQDIIESFKSGEIGEQDAVNEFQSQWELSNPAPKDGYREWSDRRAKAVDAFREKVIRAKPRSSKSVSQSQPAQPQKQLTVTDLAELRAMELRGEIPMQSQVFQTPLYEPEQPVIQEQLKSSQLQQTQPQRPSFNIVESLKSAFSRFFPRKQQQMPERPINEFGQPSSYYQCITCGGIWLNNRGEVTEHLIEGHIVKYVPT